MPMFPHPFSRFLLLALPVCLFAAGGLRGAATDDAVARTRATIGTRATYCSAPHGKDGRIDVDRLIAELIQIRANTYSFCIHGQPTDWDDLQRFLPAAAARGIRVWASIVPPSESPPRAKAFAEPFRLDYVRWAEEFAKLSLRQPALVAWSIDDFTHNLQQTFTPGYVKRMMDAAHRINPRLAFVPCCYFPALTASFSAHYASMLDGILFPYRAESGRANLTDPSLVGIELEKLRTILGADFPIVVDIYASAHSRLGATTPEYVTAVMQAAHRSADGVMIYRHQDPQADAVKFRLVERYFRIWAAAETPHGANAAPDPPDE